MPIKFLCIFLTLSVVTHHAAARADVNHADPVALSSIRGIGPVTSRSIIAERNRGGSFKDWRDFDARMKGIGEKKAAKLSQAGLTVNGQAKSDDTAAVSGRPDFSLIHIGPR